MIGTVDPSSILTMAKRGLISSTFRSQRSETSMMEVSSRSPTRKVTNYMLDWHHNGDGPNNGHGISTCGANVRHTIGLANIISHGVRYFTQPDESRAGSSIQGDNETFR